jgi:hypothetical protein
VKQLLCLIQGSASDGRGLLAPGTVPLANKYAAKNAKTRDHMVTLQWNERHGGSSCSV